VTFCLARDRPRRPRGRLTSFSAMSSSVPLADHVGGQFTVGIKRTERTNDQRVADSSRCQPTA
jgi:hypothetical protein